ncbi:MAG: hypothetical protein GDA44_00655 [Prochloron sp. SP5CPC1]|nr:hypothetical protein [Candidatus Paraprochloron terpiosi SP5CPC1]
MTQKNRVENVELLDVSLRDGGYRNQFGFSCSNSVETVEMLVSAGLRNIEIGYRNGYEGGVTARCDDDYIIKLNERVPNCRLCVMVHPDKVTESDMRALRRLGIGLVRVAFPPKYRWKNNLKILQQAFDAVNICRQADLLVSANLVQASYLQEKEMLDLAHQAEKSGANFVYVADSNGNFLPNDVVGRISLLKENLSAKIGFHPHNNLSLALSNAIAAIDSGVDIIDSSIRGYGRAAGNLSTEVFVAYLKRSRIQNSYNLVKLLELAEFWDKEMACDRMSLTPQDILFGAVNFSSPEFCRDLNDISASECISWYELAYELGKLEPESPERLSILKVASQIRQR